LVPSGLKRTAISAIFQ